jgi:diaminopimelate epimerase
MKLSFCKYSATGNDFIVIDNREGHLNPDHSTLWESLCHRRTGIGADGVLFLSAPGAKDEGVDFKMVYLNSDGKSASMCGNGSRALSHFAHFELQLPGKLEEGLEDREQTSYRFLTQNGRYHSEVGPELVSVQMTELKDQGKYQLSLDPLFQEFKNSLYLNTGVPHCVLEVDDLENYPVDKMGRTLRFAPLLGSEGANINFFQVKSDGRVAVRTYERGVEGETLACGTGATAVAIACSEFFGWSEGAEVITHGGKLKINYTYDKSKKENKISQVWLRGGAQCVFRGEVDIL